MTSNVHPGITRPIPPALADLQRRTTELLGSEPALATEQPAVPLPHAAHSLRAPDHPILAEHALYGLAGQVVRTLGPHTEADPAALLLQLLAAFGNLVGPGPHCMVNAARHGLNLFVVLVGESSKARKGTSWSQVARLLLEVDHPWVNTRVTNARLTASGLIHALRDQASPTDRRLLALSEEFASVLHTFGRTRSQLSPLLRCAWDNGHLRALQGHQPVQATGTHISLIAHITERELAQYLHHTDTQNGFANRCLWTYVGRSKCLPDGSCLAADELSPLACELRRVAEWIAAVKQIRFTRDEDARRLWHECYPALSQARPGLYGAATTRAEAQVLRLSALYSALDCSPIIALPHLQAALAVWDYCSASASLLFGTCTGDSTVDRIREAIDASREGLSRKQISGLFHGHLSSDRIDAAPDQLMSLGILNQTIQPGRGRSVTLWAANADPQPPQEGA